MGKQIYYLYMCEALILSECLVLNLPLWLNFFMVVLEI